MTLLDDARRLADGPAPTYWDQEEAGTINPRWHTPDVGPVLKCAHCRQKLHAHTDRCPVLAMPSIVAALEAAEAYLAPGSEGGGSLPRLQALEKALRGEG